LHPGTFPANRKRHVFTYSKELEKQAIDLKRGIEKEKFSRPTS